MRYLTNHNVTGFYGFTWVSQVLSAIIASERCFCILQPLRSQRVLRTSTTTAIVIVVNVIVVGLYFLVVSRYRIACVYDPVRQISFMSGVTGRFYLAHQKLIDYLDAFVYGAGLPGVMMVVVTTMTIITTIKLRQAAAWRAETSSSGKITSQEIALTEMLIGNSVLFIVCVFSIAVFRLLSSPSLCSGGCLPHFFVQVVVFPIVVFGLLSSPSPCPGCCLPHLFVQVVVYLIFSSRLLSSPSPCSGCCLPHRRVQVVFFPITVFRLLSSPSPCSCCCLFYNLGPVEVC